MSAVENVARAYARIADAERPEAWIALRPERDAQAEARAIDHRVDAGAELPLAGITVAVKDNIDVAGMDTTAACPSFAYRADVDAEVVARVRDAGAIVLGKTNMDQFATGLVGTRSPYGVVRDARRPEYVSGGSSSGSAVAVALAHVDLALATDTAGSGRVPAAFQGIFAVKPTRGLAPTLGVVPACPSLDCVSAFARTLELAHTATALMCGPHADDVTTGAWPLDAPLGAPAAPLVAVPGPRHLGPLSPAARRAFAKTVSRAREIGADVLEIDVTPFLEAGSLLYHGAFVAERYAAVGRFLDGDPDDADPYVRATIVGARSLPAHQLVSDRARLAALRHAASLAMAGADALLLPTTTSQPTIAEVHSDPTAVNDRLGTYTNFCNLFEMCAVAVPAGAADGGHFGVTLYGPGFHDLVLVDLAARMSGAVAVLAPVGPPALEVFVLGAHMTGQPLNHELTDRGGCRLREARTESIRGELWALPVAGMGSLLAGLRAPMTLGRVELLDGTEPIGFLCAPSARADTPDLTAAVTLLEAAQTTRMPTV